MIFFFQIFRSNILVLWLFFSFRIHQIDTIDTFYIKISKYNQFKMIISQIHCNLHIFRYIEIILKLTKLQFLYSIYYRIPYCKRIDWWYIHTLSRCPMFIFLTSSIILLIKKHVTLKVLFDLCRKLMEN